MTGNPTSRASVGPAAITIAVTRLPHGADLPLPEPASDHAAGVDLLAAVPEAGPVTLSPMCRALIPTGLAIALPPGFEAQVRPRSGLALKQGITVLNSPGTIDADYRGEIGVVLINLGDGPVTVTRGMRIAQLVIARHEQPAWRLVDDLPESGRGSGGFGSTGTQG